MHCITHCITGATTNTISIFKKLRKKIKLVGQINSGKASYTNGIALEGEGRGKEVFKSQHLARQGRKLLLYNPCANVFMNASRKDHQHAWWLTVLTLNISQVCFRNNSQIYKQFISLKYISLKYYFLWLTTWIIFL